MLRYLTILLLLSACGISDSETRSKLRSVAGSGDGTAAKDPADDGDAGGDEGTDTDTPSAATKIGINYENDPASTPDYADALICVEGKLQLYSVSKKITVTQDNFNVKLSFKNASTCQHTFTVNQKSSTDALLMTQDQTDQISATVEMEFPASNGDQIQLSLKSKSCSGTVSQLNVAHTSTWAKVVAGTCN